MNNKGMFYTNVSDYETKEDMMNDFISLRMYDMSKDKEIERLHSIIKEAIENIEDNWQGNYFVRYDDNVYKLCDETLEILKGVDKNG